MRVSLKMICFFLLLVALLGWLMPAAAINDLRYSSYHNMTAEEIQRIVDETTGTQIDRFEDMLESNPDVLAVYGVIPEKAKGIEAYEYWLQMGNISQALSNDPSLRHYYYASGGPIIGQGTQCVCYTSIIVLEERAHKFTEADMLAIKERADYYASLEGLQDPPLVFFKGKMADSYLTEEQILDMWESGYEGLIICDGFENLTRLRSVQNMNKNVGGFESRFAKGESFTERLRALFNGVSAPSVEVPVSGPVNQTDFANETVRPIVGGVTMATSTSGGTVGYAAKEVNRSDSRGIVTVAHVFHFQNSTSYQPRETYGSSTVLGTFSKINPDSDSVFIPMEASEVKPVIYTGEGDNRLLNVIGYEGAISSGMPLEKSGAVSGNTAGTYYGVRYNQTFTVKNGTINYTVNHVGVIQESSKEEYSVPGDSGGPIYVLTKTIVNGTEQEVAVLLGILEGGDGSGTVYYVPCTEIKDRLGVVPLTLNDR